MAPEQLHGEQVDGRTDQFAWGVLAFELLSGKLPWSANDTIGTIAAILTRAPQPLPDDVPPLLREVVLRALQREKDARFPTMERAAEIVRRFAERVEGDDAESQQFVEGPTASSGSVLTEPRGRIESSARGDLDLEPPVSTEVDPLPPKMEGTPPPFATTLQSNPANSYITITPQLLPNIERYTITSMNGSIVLERNASMDSVIDVSGLANGVYQLKAEMPNGVASAFFIKE